MTLPSLRLLHASCRKPHGGRRDGLSLALDAVAGGERPHLLILSGDQVYADDVATAFLAIIQRAAEAVIGVDEGAGFFPPSLLADRQESTDSMGFTGELSRDHLWTFGEFMAHYLLSWSDVLWPADVPQWPGAGSAEVRTPADPDEAEALRSRPSCPSPGPACSATPAPVRRTRCTRSSPRRCPATG